jgi:hypothetical protein
MRPIRSEPWGNLLALLALAGFLPVAPVAAQQVANPDYVPNVAAPAWPAGQGPRVVLDQAHHNFHTLDGRYQPFAALLRADGCRVEAGTGAFTDASLRGIDILVVANAIAEDNVENWDLPNPGAFTPGEVEAVRRWVEQGGALWLIADHQPFPAAAADLAAAFGIYFINGYAIRGNGEGQMTFRRSEGDLADHAVTRGRSEAEQVPFVISFGGQGFRLHPKTEAVPLMVLADDCVILLPEQSRSFTPATQRISGAGLFQGVVLTYGRGRVAAFGEAAMFTSQYNGPDAPPLGIAQPDAPHNQQFVLNIVHWLAGIL